MGIWKRKPRPVELQGGQTAYGEGLYNILGIAQPTTALPVTDSTVRGLPAAWAAQNKISNAVAQMMVEAKQFGADGRTPVPTSAVVDQPDVSLESFIYWKMVAGTAITRGNCIGLKTDFTSDGYPNQVIIVPSDSVHAYYDEDGFPVYEVGGIAYSADDVVHVRCGVTLPGQIMTIGVVEAHRRGLTGMLAQQGMANSVFSDGGVPAVVVQLDVDNPTETQAATVKTNFTNAHGGKRGVAVTGKKMTVTPLAWSADDAQFLETQQLSVAMTCLMFGLRPSSMDAQIGGSGLTYGNRLDDSVQTIVDSYTPVMLPIEQAWSRLVPGRQFVRGEPEALLRGTTEQRYNLRILAQQAQIETPDESREAEGKPKLPKPEAPPPPEPNEPPDPPATDTGEDRNE
jgi:HK97 family phage portal protein